MADLMPKARHQAYGSFTTFGTQSTVQLINTPILRTKVRLKTDKKLAGRMQFVKIK